MLGFWSFWGLGFRVWGSDTPSEAGGSRSALSETVK